MRDTDGLHLKTELVAGEISKDVRLRVGWRGLMRGEDTVFSLDRPSVVYHRVYFSIRRYDLVAGVALEDKLFFFWSSRHTIPLYVSVPPSPPSSRCLLLLSPSVSVYASLPLPLSLAILLLSPSVSGYASLPLPPSLSFSLSLSLSLSHLSLLSLPLSVFLSLSLSLSFSLSLSLSSLSSLLE